jgi:hemerythrin
MAIRWTKSLSVGIVAIDDQHRELFARARAFADGLQGRSRKDVGILLGYLRTYAVVHFGEEEEAMRDARYPGYREHKKQHDRFMRDLLSLLEKQGARGSGVPPKDLAGWVERWLVEHVSATDRKMARFLLAKARKKAAASA